MALPFGMYFLEKSEPTETKIDLPIYYDENEDCSMINQGHQAIPFMQSALSYLSTITVTRQEGDKPEDDEDDGDKWHLYQSVLMTITATKTAGEGPDDGDEDDSGTRHYLHPVLLTLTQTERDAEAPQGDDDEDRNEDKGW